MINVYGNPGKEPGDQFVFEALTFLSPGWLAYAQPHIVQGADERNPDYVLLHKDFGVIVLEVKDYLAIDKADSKGAWIKRNKIPDPEWEVSPVEQGRKAAELLNDKLVQNSDLRNYCGKLDFPYRYAGILPNLTPNAVTWLAGKWGRGKVLGREDLGRDIILKRISSIPAPFSVQMTDRQMDAVRAVLDDANCAVNPTRRDFKGVYTELQESIAKSSFAPPASPASITPAEKQRNLWDNFDVDQGSRMAELERDAPAEVLELRKARNVKLVRGFSGTGKTDVLVMRARYLYDLHPDIQMLVTTFNAPLTDERLTPEFRKQTDRITVRTFDSLCAAIYQRHTGGHWPKIQDAYGLLKSMEGRDDHPAELIKKYGCGFLAQEFDWMKEAGLQAQDQYLATHRDGRAKMSNRTLTKANKQEVFEVFTAYERMLADIRAFDWPDMHQKVWDFIQAGEVLDKQFDLVLIDEAQHFAPLWMKIILAHLKPNGSLFLCDDPSQSVYRFFSWEQKGVAVRGRTRWLKVPYRTTRQIFQAAYALIESNPIAKALMEESGESARPELAEQMRNGPRPELVCCTSYDREKQFICERIGELTSRILPSEIAILHTDKHVRETYQSIVPSRVKVDELRRQTGMEYKAVFIPQAQRLFLSDETTFDFKRSSAEHQLALYMAMTRARDNLWICYGSKLPKELEPITPHIERKTG